MEAESYPQMTEDRDQAGKLRAHRWALPTDPAYLEAFIADIFTRYWERLTYGPILDGVAYELTCPCAPDRFEMADGYLTIGFNGPHFHMCLGPGAWPDTEEGRKRMPGSASLFRSLDPTGAPNSWGFEMRDGAGNPMMSIYFDNPFVLAGDRLAEEPDWSCLSMWRDIARRYLGLEPDPFDETSCGFHWKDAA